MFLLHYIKLCVFVWEVWVGTLQDSTACLYYSVWYTRFLNWLAMFENSINILFFLRGTPQVVTAWSSFKIWCLKNSKDICMSFTTLKSGRCKVALITVVKGKPRNDSIWWETHVSTMARRKNTEIFWGTRSVCVQQEGIIVVIGDYQLWY